MILSKVLFTGGIMKKALLIYPLLLLAGCAGLAGRQSAIIEAGDWREVEGCQLLESFQGPSGYRMWGPPMVIGNFKNEVIRKAEIIGGTHILWRNSIHWRNKGTGLGETAVLDVYKCPLSEDFGE